MARYGEQLPLFPIPTHSEPNMAIWGPCETCGAARRTIQKQDSLGMYFLLVCSQDESHGPDED